MHHKRNTVEWAKVASSRTSVYFVAAVSCVAIAVGTYKDSVMPLWSSVGDPDSESMHALVFVHIKGGTWGGFGKARSLVLYRSNVPRTVEAQTSPFFLGPLSTSVIFQTRIKLASDDDRLPKMAILLDRDPYTLCSTIDLRTKKEGVGLDRRFASHTRIPLSETIRDLGP